MRIRPAASSSVALASTLGPAMENTVEAAANTMTKIMGTQKGRR